MLYSLHQVSEMVSLSVVTLRNYTARGRSDLTRNIDFLVRRTTPYRRQTMITQRGLFRLQARRYRVFREGKQTAAVMPSDKVPVALREGLCRSERRAWLRAVIQQVAREYERHPCTQPTCACSIHRLGMPKADVIADIFSNRPSAQPYNRARRDWYGQ